MRSIFESEEQVLKVIKAFQEHENPFLFSLTRKSTLKKIIVSLCVVRSEHCIDMLNAKSIRKKIFKRLHKAKRSSFIGLQTRQHKNTVGRSTK